MRRSLLCISNVIAAIVLSTQFAIGANLPFVGSWDCDAKKLIFTADIYNDGSEPLKIKKIKRHGKVYSLLMENNFSISLYNIQKNKMTWHSLQNGDTVECQRMPLKQSLAAPALPFETPIWSSLLTLLGI